MSNCPAAIGAYTFSNTGSVLIHEIDHSEDKVLASINGDKPEWCSITEAYREETQEAELGFFLGSFFVPFSEVMRIDGGMR